MDSAFQQALQMFQQAATNLGLNGQVSQFLTPNQNQMVPGQEQNGTISFDMPAHSTYQEFLQNLAQQGQQDQPAQPTQNPQAQDQQPQFGDMNNYQAPQQNPLLTLQQLSSYFDNNPNQQGGQQ